MMTPTDFVRESNRIENIHRDPTDAEMEEFHRFMALRTVTLDEMVKFVAVYQPDAKLRDKPGLDVRVANHVPLWGGPEVPYRLKILLRRCNVPHVLNPYNAHIEYETLHPFTDGNGRSGRILWAWMMGESLALRLGFLHQFYYQTLASTRAE